MYSWELNMFSKNLGKAKKNNLKINEMIQM